MALDDATKYTIVFRNTAVVNLGNKAGRAVLYDIYDNDKKVGVMRLNIESAILPNARMGQHGEVTIITDPSKLWDRITLTQTKKSFDRYTNEFK